MATLTVWKFDTPSGAEDALKTVEELQKQELITIVDGAVVSWPADKKKPKTHQMHSMTGGLALGGAFWGFLFGLIFFVPFLGLAIGAGMGAIMGSMTDVGIDDDFIKSVREKITPGTSALFIMTQDAVLDRVKDAFQGKHLDLIQTNLSEEQETKLREAFAEED
jgi:uncharacterized membrane protein